MSLWGLQSPLWGGGVEPAAFKFTIITQSGGNMNVFTAIYFGPALIDGWIQHGTPICIGGVVQNVAKFVDINFRRVVCNLFY